MRKKHITRLMSPDVLLGRNIRVLNIEYRPSLTGSHALLRGCFILSGNEFEVLLIDQRLVNNLKELGELKNEAIIIGDYGAVEKLT